MTDPTMLPLITREALAAARELYAGTVADCPHCGGWSKPDPRQAPIRYPSVICTNEARDTWYVRCFGCFACTSSTFAVADALESWNRREGAPARKPELLPLVALQRMARQCGLELTPALELFARQLQADVLRLNRRPLS